MVSTTGFIAAIELGSSKITGIAGKKNSDGSMEILAYAREEVSTSVRKGVVYNLNKTAQSLTSVINKLEAGLNNSISKVYVGISGQSLHSVRNVVYRDLDEDTVISEELIDSISDENRQMQFTDMDILDVIPQEYKIGNNLQVDPVGVAGNRIEGRFLNIVARSSMKKNLDHSFEQAKIEIAEQFITPVKTAEVVLSESEMRSGCALVDFGADTTTVSVYKNNILRYLTVLPVGSKNITLDLMSLQVEEDEAERIKLKYGSAIIEEKEEEAEPEKYVTENRGQSIEISLIQDIVEARVEEIIANVWNQIQLSGYDDKLMSGIVITGGGAKLQNIDEAIRRKTQLFKVRTATTIQQETHEYDELVKNGTHNALLGLLFAGKEDSGAVKPQASVAGDTPTGLFDDDEALKQQEDEARLKKIEEEKKKKKEASRRNPWTAVKGKFEQFSKDIFTDEDMK